MIDLHCHILPHLDDGARDWPSALEMARLAVEDGITDIVATPHMQNELHRCESAEVLAVVDQFQEKLMESEIPLRVHPGAEVHVHVQMLKNLQTGKVLTVGNKGKYVLLEWPVLHLPPHADDLVVELLEAGYIPLIAHPERNAVIRRHPERLAAWIEKGAVAQLTADSLLGHLGKQTKAIAAYLVQKSLVHVIASDAHNTTRRRPRLREAYRELLRLTNEEAVHLFQKNAASILRGEPCVVHRPYTEFRRCKFRWF